MSLLLGDKCEAKLRRRCGDVAAKLRRRCADIAATYTLRRRRGARRGAPTLRRRRGEVLGCADVAATSRRNVGVPLWASVYRYYAYIPRVRVRCTGAVRAGAAHAHARYAQVTGARIRNPFSHKIEELDLSFYLVRFRHLNEIH